MRKVLVIGPEGAGKSTLVSRLADLDLPPPVDTAHLATAASLPRDERVVVLRTPAEVAGFLARVRTAPLPPPRPDGSTR